MERIKNLKLKWLDENVIPGSKADKQRIARFQEENHIILPDDLIEYFSSLNGTGESCTDDLFEFYSIDRILTVKDEFKDWHGIPKHHKLIKNNEVNNLYVFANFSFNLFAYAIKLYPTISKTNDIYVLCGPEYEKICDSFSEFIDLYINDSIELQLGRA
jgi:hypothetical protein